MDAFEGGMPRSDHLSNRQLVARQARETIDPIAEQSWHLSVVWRLHAASEGVDVVASPVARALVVVCVWMRGGLPDRGQRKSVHLTNLRNCEELAALPQTLACGLAVDPAGRGRVTRHLEVILKFLAADCLAFA